jgi:hypothetical protein
LTLVLALILVVVLADALPDVRQEVHLLGAWSELLAG